MNWQERHQLYFNQEHKPGNSAEKSRFYQPVIEALSNGCCDYWFVNDYRPGIYCCCDANLNLTFVNDAYAAYDNCPPHRLVGANALTLLPSVLHPYITQILGYLNPAYPVCIAEMQLNAPEDHPLWVRWTIRAVYDGADPLEYQVCWEDITDIKLRELRLNQDRRALEAMLEDRGKELQNEISKRKAIEEELFRKEKLESLGILASGIAHDFNNILTIISGNNSLANIILEEKGDYEVCELLDEIQRGVMQARELTEQLMTFSRGGAPVKEVSSIEELVQESAGFVLRGSSVRAIFSIGGAIWPVDIDRGQISQVFHNLLLNAAQAMPNGGIIEVFISNIMPETAAALALHEGRYVQIVVKDHGTGIASEDLSNVFVPYFTTKDKGHGLGLAMAYSIIKKHDGVIKVSSELGIGSTFEVYLPASDQSIAAKSNQRRVNLSGQGRILVMDDDRIVRNTLGRMLNQLGYKTDLAGDGQEAIQMYIEARQAGSPYHAVIMDLTIAGGMGARETVQKLRQIDSNIRAIVSSGYSSDEVLLNYDEYGFCGVIEKPVEIERLSQVLYEALGLKCK